MLLAFDCFPKVKIPTQKSAGKDRLFELRVYESPTDLLGHLKVEMFNSGEVPIFLDCGIQPVFMGQAFVGDKLPNLTYMTVYDNAEQRDECWKKFQKHPDWQVLKGSKSTKEPFQRFTKRICFQDPIPSYSDRLYLAFLRALAAFFFVGLARLAFASTAAMTAARSVVRCFRA